MEPETCVFCLDDLTDPQTLECGHSFDRACYKEYVGPCPICRHETTISLQDFAQTSPPLERLDVQIPVARNEAKIKCLAYGMIGWMSLYIVGMLTSIEILAAAYDEGVLFGTVISTVCFFLVQGSCVFYIVVNGIDSPTFVMTLMLSCCQLVVTTSFMSDSVLNELQKAMHTVYLTLAYVNIGVVIGYMGANKT